MTPDTLKSSLRKAKLFVEEWDSEVAHLSNPEQRYHLVRRLVAVFEHLQEAEGLADRDYVTRDQYVAELAAVEAERDDLRLNFNRLLSGDYRALSPEWQSIFDRLRDAESAVARLREALFNLIVSLENHCGPHPVWERELVDGRAALAATEEKPT